MDEMGWRRQEAVWHADHHTVDAPTRYAWSEQHMTHAYMTCMPASATVLYAQTTHTCCAGAVKFEPAQQQQLESQLHMCLTTVRACVVVCN